MFTSYWTPCISESGVTNIAKQKIDTPPPICKDSRELSKTGSSGRTYKSSKKDNRQTRTKLENMNNDWQHIAKTLSMIEIEVNQVHQKKEKPGRGKGTTNKIESRTNDLQYIWTILQRIPEPQRNEEQMDESEERDGTDNARCCSQSIFLILNIFSLRTRIFYIAETYSLSISLQMDSLRLIKILP
jgi:hypothetical protein